MWPRQSGVARQQGEGGSRRVGAEDNTNMREGTRVKGAEEKMNIRRVRRR